MVNIPPQLTTAVGLASLCDTLSSSNCCGRCRNRITAESELILNDIKTWEHSCHIVRRGADDGDRQKRKSPPFFHLTRSCFQAH